MYDLTLTEEDSLTVHKFGGSSFRDETSFNHTINLIKSFPPKSIIVVSAAYGITNFLIESLDKKLDPQYILSHLKNKYLDLCKTSPDIENTITDALNDLQEILSAYSHGAIELRDYILSFGERLMVILLSKVLSAKYIMAEEFVRITNGRIDYESTKQLVQSIHWPEITVVPGYYGLTEKGEIALLGRSGTDYSATSLAYTLELNHVTIWKDVSGFMTVDPHLVPEAKTIKNLWYDEAEILSNFGAKILHPMTINAARMGNLTVIIKDTRSNMSTTISSASSNRSICISYIRGIQKKGYCSDLSVLSLSLLSSVHFLNHQGGDFALIYISSAPPNSFCEVSKLIDSHLKISTVNGIYLLVNDDQLVTSLRALHSFYYELENISMNSLSPKQ